MVYLTISTNLSFLLWKEKFSTLEQAEKYGKDYVEDNLNYYEHLQLSYYHEINNYKPFKITYHNK